MLDSGGFLFSEKKIRVEADAQGQTHLNDEQGTFLADPRIGRECWLVGEALVQR